MMLSDANIKVFEEISHASSNEKWNLCEDVYFHSLRSDSASKISF